MILSGNDASAAVSTGKNRLPSLLRAAAVLIIAAAALLLPKAAADGTRYGLELCLSTVIPSLFVLMLASVLTVECGFAQRLGRLLSPAASLMFGLPGESGAALLLSVLGGYPAGAKTVRGLYERGAVTLEEARRMSNFCFCAGPAFLIGTVGTALLGDVRSGVVLLAAQLITVPLTGVLLNMLSPRCVTAERTDNSSVGGSPVNQTGFTDAFVSAARQSASAMLSVCLFVVVFTALRYMLDASVSPMLCSLLRQIGLSERISAAVLPVLLEVTGGCAAAAPCGLPLVAFAVGFGGISVHMQVFSLLGNCVRKGSFFASRLLQGTLSAAVTALFLRLLPERAVAVSAQIAKTASLSGTVTGAATLVLMCVMCLLCLPERPPYKY